MWIISVLLLILILGVIILIHELGHFFWAKKFGVHIYEFSIGMGPVIYSKKGKDKIIYNLRAIPIGGFVSMAGEVYEDDDTKKIPKDKFMCNKPWYQRVIILIAGVVNNLISAVLLLFFGALIWGGTTLDPVIDEALVGYPAHEAGIENGDRILKINGYKISNWDVAQIVLHMNNENDYTEFLVEKENGEEKLIKVTPIVEKNEETGEETKVFGIQMATEKIKGFLPSLKYGFTKFTSIVQSMWLTITSLITGKISLDALSGPVGIYEVVDDSISVGISQIIYLLAFLSINVGFINILPFPAFDGGRVLFIIIEKIKGSPVNQKFENLCHTIGFILLMALILFITVKDIIKLF